VDGVQLIGVLVAELAGDQGADVAAGGGVLAVAKRAGHQGVPESATFQEFMSGWLGSGVENPKPGTEGTITSNASAGSPTWAPGSPAGR
jgi:hypothetical protein